MDSIQEFKEQILSRIKLSELIGKHVQLTKKGRLETGCCPFHEEKSPSFTVYPDHYFCFGCRESGDAISFIRKMNNLGYSEALFQLAEIAGIDASSLKGDLAGQARRGEARAKALGLLELAQAYFTKELWSSRGEAARKYLENRGIREETVKEFGLGLAPEGTATLISHLRSKGAFEKDLVKVSLANESPESGRFYDFFRNRLMVPIRDGQSRIVGFGGRSLDDQMPKYKNSRESEYFQKSQLLYGFDRIRRNVGPGKPCLMVEGYFDVMRLSQEGLDQACAAMGTAASLIHFQQIAATGSELVLLLDGDSAGQKASLATVSTALQVPGLNVRVCSLPDKADPDDFVASKGVDALRALINTAPPLLDFAIREVLKASRGMELVSVIQNSIVPWLGRVADPLRRSFLVSRVADLSGLHRNDIEQVGRDILVVGGRDEVKLEETTNFEEKFSRFEFELLGLVFYIAGSQVNLDRFEMEERLSRSLVEISASCQNLLMVFLKLGEKEVLVHSCPASTWTSAGLSDYALETIEKIKNMEGAFSGQKGLVAIDRLFDNEHRLKIKKTIDRLKAELTLAQETLPILTEISVLQRDLNAVETRLKS